MYTLQALWTQARENLDVTTIIYANHSYAILKYELLQTGIAETAGKTAQSLLSLSDPNLDWVSLAGGMGVPAGRAISAETFYQELEKGIAIEGPYLIEATIKPILEPAHSVIRKGRRFIWQVRCQALSKSFATCWARRPS